MNIVIRQLTPLISNASYFNRLLRGQVYPDKYGSLVCEGNFYWNVTFWRKMGYSLDSEWV